MTPTVTATKSTSAKPEEAMTILFQKLNEAIDDMEQGRIQTLDEAWEEIDQI
ncbi:MAG: hypothetical protein RR869_07420 [Lachnospiraceae bacterium]